MVFLKTCLMERFPELFLNDTLVNKLAIEVPLECDRDELFLDPKVGQTVRHGLFNGHGFHNGHVLRVFEGKLRWASVTVVNGVTDYFFVADLAMIDGKLVVQNFQWKGFGDFRAYKLNMDQDYVELWLAEHNDDDNYWHEGYKVLTEFPDDEFHPEKVLYIHPASFQDPWGDLDPNLLDECMEELRICEDNLIDKLEYEYNCSSALAIYWLETKYITTNTHAELVYNRLTKKVVRPDSYEIPDSFLTCYEHLEQ